MVIQTQVFREFPFRFLQALMIHQSPVRLASMSASKA